MCDDETVEGFEDARDSQGSADIVVVVEEEATEIVVWMMRTNY